jgi:hypothetical protein
MYNPSAMPGDFFRISHTKILSFDKCRKQYWFRYLSGLPRPQSLPNAPGVIGTGVHRAMKALSDTGIPEDGANELDTYLRMPVHECAGPGTEFFSLAFEIFARGCEAHASIESEDRWSELETWVAWPSRAVTLSARIDRVDRLGPDHYQVIDWKTGRYDLDEVVDFQLDIGHLAARTLRRLAPDAHVTAIGWNLRTGQQRIRELGRAQAAATMHRVAGIADRIQATTAFEATPCSSCLFCEWRPQCPEAAGAIFDESDYEEEELPALEE